MWLYPQSAPDLVIAGLIAAVGLVVLAARPKDVANVYFAAFMGFIAAGIVLGALKVDAGVVAYEAHAAAAAGRPADVAGAWRVASLFQRLFWIPYVFDPLVLLYFASVYPRRNRLNSFRVLAPFALVAGIVLLIDVLAPLPLPPVPTHADFVGPLGTPLARFLLLGYMLSAYLLALWSLAAGLRREPGEITRKRAVLLVVGLGVAVFSRMGLALDEVRGVLGISLTAAGTLAARLLYLAVAMAAAFVFFSLLPRPAVEGGEDGALLARRWTLRLLPALALVWLPDPFVNALGYEGWTEHPVVVPFFAAFDRAVYSSRWLVFGCLVGYSLLRYQLFDLPAKARRLALHAAVLAAWALALVALASLASWLDPGWPAARPSLLLVGAAGAAVVAVGLHEATRRLAARSEDASDVRLRKLEVLRAAMEVGGSVAALRERLGISEDEAAALERLVEAPPTPGAALVPGAVVAGRYRIVRFLGRGGEGRAFLADDPLLRRQVVLKEIFDDEPGAAASALAVARLAGSLSHPNVVVVHDTLRRGRDYVIVMEHVPGGSLEARLRDRGPLPPDEALRVLDGVLAGLAAAHARGIAHGDVKPANVLLGDDGTPKLADFGVARHRGAGTVRSVGGLTPAFAAPETLHGAPATPAADAYSAAVLFLALLLPPSNAPPHARLDEAAALVSSSVVAVLRQALADDPARRFPDADAMRRALAFTDELVARS